VDLKDATLHRAVTFLYIIKRLSRRREPLLSARRCKSLSLIAHLPAYWHERGQKEEEGEREEGRNDIVGTLESFIEVTMYFHRA